MKTLIDSWSRYLSKEEVDEHMIAFCQASQEDKECMIAEIYGIFEGKLVDDVFTYYFHIPRSDSIMDCKHFGTENWWKDCEFRRVDYNFMTDKAVVTEVKKRTKQIVEMATENYGRSL